MPHDSICVATKFPLLHRPHTTESGSVCQNARYPLMGRVQCRKQRERKKQRRTAGSGQERYNRFMIEQSMHRCVHVISVDYWLPPSVYHGRARATRGPNIDTAGRFETAVLTKRNMFGDGGLYSEMTPAGGGPSAQASPDVAREQLWQLGLQLPESE